MKKQGKTRSAGSRAKTDPEMLGPGLKETMREDGCRQWEITGGLKKLLLRTARQAKREPLDVLSDSLKGYFGIGLQRRKPRSKDGIAITISE